jgi:hypothetical protein
MGRKRAARRAEAQDASGPAANDIPVLKTGEVYQFVVPPLGGSGRRLKAELQTYANRKVSATSFRSW